MDRDNKLKTRHNIWTGIIIISESIKRISSDSGGSPGTHRRAQNHERILYTNNRR